VNLGGKGRQQGASGRVSTPAAYRCHRCVLYRACSASGMVVPVRVGWVGFGGLSCKGGDFERRFRCALR